VAWIPSHQELARHPKTRRLARLLRITVPTAIGHLHLLWWWALDYAPDGRLDRYDADDLADATMWEGDPAELMEGLIAAGFIDSDDDGRRLHDWDEYAGTLHQKREQTRERQQRFRARLQTPPRDSSQAALEPDGVSRVSNALVTRYDSVSHALLTPLEKSREEKSREEIDSSSELSAPTPPDSVSREKTFGEESEEYRLAEHLRERILGNNPRAKVPRASPNGLARWCREFDLMIRLDGRAPPDIRRVIDWCQADSFWRANILSPRKLREKFDTLWLQMQRNGEVKRERGTDSDPRRAELKQRYANAARIAVAVPEVRET